MKQTALILMLTACTVAATAQTPAPPTAPAAKPAVAATTAKPATAAAKPAVTATTATSSTAKPAAAAAKAAPATPPTVAAFIKEPAAIPAVKGIQKPLFTAALRYKEIKVGAGAVAEPGKLYKVLYTGYRASDGVIFDSTALHPRPPVLDKDGKPVLGDDGKPKQGPPQPMPFPQGIGGTIIGFDQGFAGMKVGGQRRIFIPWQMGYGTRTVPDRGPDHPGIPAKSDLIFDVELVDVTDMPAQQARPGMMPGMRPGASGQPMSMKPGAPGAPGAPMQMMVAPKPAPPPAPGIAPSTAAPATPTAPPVPGAAPKPPAPPAPAPPATTPAVPPTPAPPQTN
jgi:peptidylprolyl isomerase